MAASTEVGAGLLLAVGLLTSLAAAAVIGVMTVAGWTSHRTNGFFIIKEGWEYVFLFFFVSMSFATLGPFCLLVYSSLFIDCAMDGLSGFWSALWIGVGGFIAQMLTLYRPSNWSPGD